MGGFHSSGGSLSSVIRTSGIATDIGLTFSRPNNTTPYTANNVINGNPSIDLEFQNIAAIVGGNGYITKAHIMTNATGLTPRLRLHLFGGGVSSPVDQSNMQVLFSNREVRLGFIDFPALSFQPSGNSSFAQVTDLRLYFKTDIPTSHPSAKGKTIYAILETLDAFTPVANQEFYIQLCAEQYQ
jgi:hypothetical protein